jgi:transposase
MIKLTVSDHERRQVEDTCKTTTERRWRARCQALLMATRGRLHRHRAEDLGISVRTSQRWLQASQAPRGAGLKSRWGPGRGPRLPEALAPAILPWITRGPTGGGLDRAHGTSAELAASLSSTPGITVSARPRRAFCPRHGVWSSRPTSHDLPAGAAPQETARQELQALKKLTPARSSCGVKMKRASR